MIVCKVCGYCPCCGKIGKNPHDWMWEKYFPEHQKELLEHYNIFPEHKTGVVQEINAATNTRDER